MWNYIWPIALAVLSNIFYHICSKSSPNNVDPFATLTVTYLVGAFTSLVLYYAIGNRGNLLQEYKQLNWAPFVLGFVIVGLEVGFMYAYRNGWTVNTASVVQSAFLAVALLFVGLLIFKEPISWNKAVGMIVCLIGLVLINLK